jgi:hypothetical protein
MSSGGISVVSGMLPPDAAGAAAESFVAESAATESVAALSPQAEKMSALDASVSNTMFFMIGFFVVCYLVKITLAMGRFPVAAILSTCLRAVFSLRLNV